jgi:hypothetical protein
MPGQIQLIVGGEVAMASVEDSIDTEVGDWLYCGRSNSNLVSEPENISQGNGMRNLFD